MAHLQGSSYVKIVLIILLCLVICGSLTGGFFFLHKATDAWHSQWDRQDQIWATYADASSGSFSTDASDVNDIDISWIAGMVTVDVVTDTQTGGSIQVTETGDTRIPLRWRNDGGRLSIDYGSMRGIVSCSMLSYKGKDLEVLIPESRAADLGSFGLDAASGEYHINRLGCDSLTVNLASGNIQLSDISADDVVLEIASGQLSYDGNISDGLAIDQASGNVKICLDSQNPRSADLNLASGDMELMLPVPSFRLDLSRLSGNFNSDFELRSNGDTFYCEPSYNAGSEGTHDADEAHEDSHQSRISMNMMSGSFSINRS